MKIKNTLTLFVPGLLIGIVAFMPMIAGAATSLTLGNLVPCGNGNGTQTQTAYNSTNGQTASTNGCDFDALVTLIKNVTNILIIISAPICVGIMIWAGFVLLLSMGSSDKLNQAKRVLMNTFIAFIIILSGWLIVHLIAIAFFNPSFNIFLSATQNG